MHYRVIKSCFYVGQEWPENCEFDMNEVDPLLQKLLDEGFVESADTPKTEESPKQEKSEEVSTPTSPKQTSLEEVLEGDA